MDASDLQIIGWREYVALPDFGVRAIKVKVDTGARSSSLHAFEIESFTKQGVEHVRFKIHPIQKSDAREVVAECPVFDYRSVRSSSGESSFRYVVLTNISLLGRTWPVELTLANRDQMGFRMLLGRQAMRGHMLVDPGRSYIGGKPKRKRLQ